VETNLKLWNIRYVTAKTLLGHNYTTEETDAWKHVDVDFDAKYIDNLASPIGKPMKFPRKQNVPGQTSGLTFFLKQTVGNVGCVRSEGTGFRVCEMISSPSCIECIMRLKLYFQL